MKTKKSKTCSRKGKRFGGDYIEGTYTPTVTLVYKDGSEVTQQDNPCRHVRVGDTVYLDIPLKVKKKKAVKQFKKGIPV